jgi:farnesyl diphosphate synthase
MGNGGQVACVTIAAVAAMHLSDRLDGIAAGFFAFAPTEQVALLALVFSVIFAAVSYSRDAQQKSSDSKAKAKHGFTVQHEAPVAHHYPLAEIERCTTDRDRFLAVYPMISNEILAHMRKNNEMPEEAVQWVNEMMEYTVPGGKLNRGTTVLAVVKELKQRDLSATEIARAAVLGWSIEFLQAFFLVADDVMDDSQTRRGQPCWYKLPKVKLISINDSFLLESFVFWMLRQHFSHEPYYTELVELLLDVTQKTEFGQLLDLTSQEQDSKIDLNRFTLDRYKSIVKYKTAFYSFYLPVALGMLMAGIDDAEAYNKARKILTIMGEYFQVQDDYLDCFGDPAVIGKVGTDIQDNKCSWLVVQALNKCIPEQRKVLENNYGVWDDAKVAKVKALYKDLGIPETFEKYEEESYRQIQAELDLVTFMPRAVFEILLDKIYKRSK